MNTFLLVMAILLLYLAFTAVVVRLVKSASERSAREEQFLLRRFDSRIGEPPAGDLWQIKLHAGPFKSHPE